MIFNVKNPRAQARAQAAINRQQLLLEVTFRKRVHALLDAQYKLVAAQVRAGNTNVNALIDGAKSKLRKIYAEEYVRVANVFHNIVMGAYKEVKTNDSPDEIKSMRDTFWSIFFGYVRTKVAEKVVGVTDTTKNNIRSIIEESTADGKSYGLIADDIWSATTSAINLKRAIRIARTEVHAASNTATQAAVESTGLHGLTREWIAMADERVRVTHRHAHGQVRGMNEPFDVGGEALQFPGDPNGSAGNVINCRCVLLYHTGRGADRNVARQRERTSLLKLPRAWE